MPFEALVQKRASVKAESRFVRLQTISGRRTDMFDGDGKA